MSTKRVLFNKTLAGLMAASMAVTMFPTTAFAAAYKDDTYTGTATVKPDEDEDFDAYDIQVDVTVSEGKITSVDFSKNCTFGTDPQNETLSKKAMEGTESKTGVAKQIIENQGADGINAVSSATCTSDAIVEAVSAALANAEESEQESKTESGSQTESESETKAPDTVKVDTTALQAALAEAEKYKESDYTADSWKNFEDAVTAAKAALTDAGQATVADAIKALKDAIDKLEKEVKEYYVVMNIPYSAFYDSEIKNDDAVDAVASATKNKSQRFPNTYFESTGETIKGIQIPVHMDADTYKALKDKVTDEHADYYISEVLTETPAVYKELTYSNGTYSVGKVQGETSELTDQEASLSTDTPWGDYLIKVSEAQTGENVYGAYLTTTDGKSYGLRHLENIWNMGSYGQIAWSSGVKTTEPHGNTLNPEHYKELMGKTIESITWICADGVKTVKLGSDGLYVPLKDNIEVTVDDAAVTSGKTKVGFSGNLPADFKAEYTVDGLSNVKVEDGLLTYDAKTAMAGSYTLTVSDTGRKYADKTASFVLSTDVIPAVYNNDVNAPALVKADDVTEEEFANFIKNIKTVSVNDQSYNASGKRATVIVKEDGTIDTTATPFAEGDTFKIIVNATGYKPLTFTYSAPAYQYVYAGLTWAEYWAAEGVQSAGSSAASDEADKRGEYDKGAFDTVSRATTNHGLHRGSYQCSAVIFMKDGTQYDVAYYTGATTVVLTDGTEVTYDKANIDHYVVTGLKYVPVKVASADYEDFCKEYAVVENGGKLAGGFSEQQLSSYTDVVAEVTEKTNGLKTATKNTDGSFSFSSRAAGDDSGIQGTALKTASGIEPTVKEANGSYGEFLRVDLNGSYGDLAANMQAVKWTYYGSDSTYSKALATYGTKFAADNWMHKSMGIQLGLTDSLRCALPEGTDGTGYWTLTVYALGYADYTYRFEATDANIVKADPVQDTSELEKAIADAEALTESDYTADSWASMLTELAEAKEELEAKHSQSAVDEATAHLKAAIEALVKAEEETVYLLMNIPYADFYAAEVNNTVAVDAFSSATLNKTRTASLAGGSYHVNVDGSDITGITFPVKVGEGVDLSKFKQVTDEDAVKITVTNRGQTSTTEYKGQDALFENASYSYYVLNEMPSYYKEVTVNADGSLSFGKVVGEVTTLSGVTGDLSTESRYGDYELVLDGFEAGADSKIYGVVISTKEGNDYGLRHLENIWRVTDLAWSTGFTKAVHNCPTSSAHYAAMMGQTINKVTYYTSEGIYEMPIGEVYVPVKFEYTMEVTNAAVTSGATVVKLEGLPADYAAEYSVAGLNGANVADGKLTFTKGADKGKYTLTVSDKNGKYASVSTTFELYTEDMPAVYNEDSKAPALVAAEGFSVDAFKEYISSITSVIVNGESYAASGRGAVVIIKEDGTLDISTAPFAEGDTFVVTVAATGYQPLTFTYSTKAAPIVDDNKVDTSALEKLIAEAESKNKDDYTSESWEAFGSTLAEAKVVLAAKESQSAVDEAAKALNAAIAGLKAVSTEPADNNNTVKPDDNNSNGTTKPDDKNNNSTTSGNKNNTTANNNKTNTTKTSPKTGDPVNVLGLLAVAASSVGIGGLGLKLRRRSKRKDEE